MSTPLKDRFKVVPAVYVLFRDGDKILLLRRANTGYHDGDYSGPAGHVDGGEPAIMAAIREAKEEVGVVLKPEDLKLVHTLHRFSAQPEPHERIDLFFETARWSGDIQNMEPQKCDELRWASKDNLPENLVPEVEHVLAQLAAGRSYSDYNFK